MKNICRVPTNAEVERYARAICRAWSMDPDSQVLLHERDQPFWWWHPRRTCLAWKADDVQRFAWAIAACIEVDADGSKL